MSKCLVVLSGGQDSTTCLAWAKKKFSEVHALTIDYGQRHAIEVEAALTVASIIGVASHEVIRIPGILTGRSFLTNKDAAVEEFEGFDLMEHHNAFKQNKLDSSFVPMRNALFLNIAANRAYVLGAEAIITGVTAADFAEFSEFSWAWLGGYLDACGGVEDGGILTCPSDDPEFLRRLKNWLLHEAPHCDATHGTSAVAFSAEAVYPVLSAHLYQRPAEADLNVKPITSAYIAGFWEGCGGVYATFGPSGNVTTIGPKLSLTFKHRDRFLLKRIQQVMGNQGLIYPEDNGHKFLLPVGEEMYAAFRSNLCLLSSFEKLTKARHSIGLHAGGFNPPYPDCSPDFIFMLNKQIGEALRVPGVEAPLVIAPLMFRSKAQSVLMAMRLPKCMEALAHSHTSYDGLYPPTGNNHANLLRAKGFEDAGCPDPLVIRAWMEGLMPLPETANYDVHRIDLED